MGFFVALSFLTIIPMPHWRKVEPEEIGHSLVYFPLVGVVIGLILVGLNWLLTPLLPAMVVNGLLMVAMVVISGALHLDGLIDTCDGLAGQKTVEARWQIMHEGRVGAFGVIGAILVLLVKYVSLSSVPETLKVATLVLMPVVSRWAMVYALFVYPYAWSVGLGKVFKQGASGQRLTLATIITLVITIALARLITARYFYLVGIAIMVGIWVLTAAVANYLKREFSGLSGDTYGAINEVAEVSVLLLVCLLAYNRWLI